jgi:multidrug efflux pump subunit AcrB
VKKNEGLLVRLSAHFFSNWRFTFLLWLTILGFGVYVYTSAIQREGFPSIQFPLTVINGTYFVDDKDRVDKEVVIPLSGAIGAVDGVESVTASAGPNFFNAVVFFESGVSPESGTSSIKSVLSKSGLPETARLSYTTVDPAGFLNEFDMLLSVYSTEPTTFQDRDRVASYVSEQLRNDPALDVVRPILQEESGFDPVTGDALKRQTSFGRIGIRENGGLTLYDATTIGVDRNAEAVDIIELSQRVNARLSEMDLSEFGDQYKVVIGAEFGNNIQNQIASLQTNLLSGLLAVVIVSCLFVTWRASIITGLLMLTVVAATVGIMYLVGYTLNTITLFALVLSLGLFVDDSTIVAEAITANRNGKRKPLEVVKRAIGMIGLASFAGSLTTILAFLPLAFVSGILGEFIRLLPITVIISLATSLFLSLTIIPFLARFLILRGRRPGEDWYTRNNYIGRGVVRLGVKAGSVVGLLKTNRRLGLFVGIGMVMVSFLFIGMALVYAQKLSFNIFPPTKDSDRIGYQVTFPPNSTVEQAEEMSREVDDIITKEIGPYVEKLVYGYGSVPTEREADVSVVLKPFREREPTSPELIQRAQAALEQQLTGGVSARLIQFDAGPPASEYPLRIQIKDEDVERGLRLASEVQAHIDQATITRRNGTTATITRTKPANPFIVTRVNGERTLEVQGAFSSDDTSGLLIAAESFVKDKFTAEYLEQNGYSKDSLGFDFGQESENAESFQSLAYIFPLVLLAMFTLLAIQFKSVLQPLLIFMAIPFGLFGVFAALYYTNNALSFFVQVGLIGLIGIAVNNTILLTDYANQERRAGATAIDAISDATTRRFRPLITTTLTTVAALVPLALSDPFWEALAVTIIFGLLSSTFLVIVAFPYYYLAIEWVRTRARRRLARKSRP